MRREAEGSCGTGVGVAGGSGGPDAAATTLAAQIGRRGHRPGPPTLPASPAPPAERHATAAALAVAVGGSRVRAGGAAPVQALGRHSWHACCPPAAAKVAGEGRGVLEPSRRWGAREGCAVPAPITLRLQKKPSASNELGRRGREERAHTQAPGPGNSPSVKVVTGKQKTGQLLWHCRRVETLSIQDGTEMRGEHRCLITPRSTAQACAFQLGAGRGGRLSVLSQLAMVGLISSPSRPCRLDMPCQLVHVAEQAAALPRVGCALPCQPLRRCSAPRLRAGGADTPAFEI